MVTSSKYAIDVIVIFMPKLLIRSFLFVSYTHIHWHTHTQAYIMASNFGTRSAISK